jgi:Fic family protein
VSFAKCRSCDRIRDTYLAERLEYRCEDEPLCHFLDERLAELVGRTSAASHRQLAERVQYGHNTALTELGEWRLPKTANEFAELLLRAHAKIFDPEIFYFGGRFRVAGEPILFGDGRHERSGVLAEDIRDRLDGLFSRVLSNTDWGKIRRRSVTRACAMFLEDFFGIHPFLDGNGRVARLMVRLFVRETERFEILRFQDHGHDDPAYIAALEQAHDDRELSGEIYGAYEDLMAWIDRQIQEKPVSSELEEPGPPSFIGQP